MDKLPQFLSLFDIVIADDQGLDLPMRIIEEIVDAMSSHSSSGENRNEK